MCHIVSKREIVTYFDRSYRCIIVTSKEVFINPYEEKPCTMFVLNGVGTRKNTTASGKRIEASMLSQTYLYMNS